VPHPTPLRRPRRVATALAGLLAVLSAVTGLTVTAGTQASAATEKAVTTRFLARESYVGTFADPSVMRVGKRFIAAATTTANLNLPVMTSKDLVTWRPRAALPDHGRYSSWPMYNDAMPIKPTWAATTARREKVLLMSQWAPSLAKVRDHYVAAYSAAVRLEPRHSCIGIAKSATPLGLYQDTRSEPLVCFKRAPLGAIDPEVFVDPVSGKPFLLWKQEGIPGEQPPMLMIRRLKPSGTGFKQGSRKVKLATRDQSWEGGVVENPAMIHHAGRYYLFYSGNAWQTGSYATGYAICDTPQGPCTKPLDEPLMVSGAGMAGPGGADPFVDFQDNLRLAYAAWDTGRIGPGNGFRRLHVATVSARDNGRLRVTALG
jgi:beta-xylosidase